MTTAMPLPDDLLTLRLGLDPARAGTDVAFRLGTRARGWSEAARCSADDIGLGASSEPGRRIGESISGLPSHVSAELHRAATDFNSHRGADPTTLWIEFVSPRGLLHVLPWERWLIGLGRRVMRLPNSPVRPTATEESIRVAICSSGPAAKEWFQGAQLIRTICDQYRRVGRPVSFEVFIDQSWFRGITDELRSYDISVHEPEDARSFELLDRTSADGKDSRVTNPWLVWMRDVARSHSFDMVHFVTHGYLSSGHGAIAMAPSPLVNDDPHAARFVGAAEVSAFLTQCGAWGLGLSGPHGNHSAAGLRELADAVALVRPGLVTVHEFSDDPDGFQLGEMLNSVLSPPARPALLESTIGCWIHPGLVDFTARTMPEPLRRSLTGALATETWLASSYRALEDVQQRWLPSASEPTSDPAADLAIRNVVELLARHANRDLQ